MLRVGLVAGEASGDFLGAGLIHAFRALRPDAVFEGVAGPQMSDAGCVQWVSSHRLAVMGLVEVLSHLPDLLQIRKELLSRFIANPPDVFVGIDSPDFTLPLEAKLKAAGIHTVHYVSPQFWAWRPGRVRKITRAADLVLCLLPFEKDFYDQHGVAAEFIGHPLADRIPRAVDQAEARRALGIALESPVVAVMPGSRVSEMKHLREPFARAVCLLAARRPELRFVAPMANTVVRGLFEASLRSLAPSVEVKLLDADAHGAMAACDVALLASGTASLEAMLFKRPMVVAYRVAPLTSWILSRLINIDSYAMPNLLAGSPLVPEIMQDSVTGESLADAVLAQLDDPKKAAELKVAFDRIHDTLSRDASRRAALAVLELIGAKDQPVPPW